ncbi:MAG: AbrB/MazE/SpoVT family DNA-binding domain-containing protein [Clostridia bacterium]|nr:AbrB/MazE/SpoVT family DNA-binding domain-containing protein [Clostridia bacterium]
MRDTGIVRRIDELGRVVIPKEIRKTLRIKEGDPLEIYTDKEQLIFTKYSPIQSIEVLAKSVCDSMYELLETPCYITDTNTVLCVAGGKKDLVKKHISVKLEKALKERKSLVICKEEGGTIIPVCLDDETDIENQIVVPIICNGDCFGSIVIFNKERAKRFNSLDVKLVRLGASVLARQFE